MWTIIRVCKNKSSFYSLYHFFYFPLRLRLSDLLTEIDLIGIIWSLGTRKWGSIHFETTIVGEKMVNLGFSCRRDSVEGVRMSFFLEGKGFVPVMICMNGCCLHEGIGPPPLPHFPLVDSIVLSCHQCLAGST